MPKKSIELVEQYLICKQRGHEEDYDADYVNLPNGHLGHPCKFCGTIFWTEEILHEENVPTIKLNELKKAKAKS